MRTALLAIVLASCAAPTDSAGDGARPEIVGHLRLRDRVVDLHAGMLDTTDVDLREMTARREATTPVWADTDPSLMREETR